MRKPGYLLKRLECQALQVRGMAAFDAEKRLRQLLWNCRSFLMIWCCICGFPLTISLQIARQMIPAWSPGGRRISSPFLKRKSAAAVCRAAAAFVVMLMEKTLHRVLLAGTNSGCGKTTLVSGLLFALSRRGDRVCSFKCGPDYIDPMFHASALHTPCRNLDLQFLPEDTLRYLMARGSTGYDLAVTEGVMGYYDGVGLTTAASSYAVARATNTPTVLTVDARGAAHSVLAVISGFLNLHPDSGIEGVVLNRCSPMLYPRLRDAILETFGGRVKPLGYLPVMKDCTLESRHLGLITAQEMTDLQEKLGLLADQIEKSVDIPGILALAAEAPPLTWEEPTLPPKVQKVRVAVARDRAFCFYYQDNLDLLQELGAELVSFSPLEEETLPENIQGLYLGGGYPELYLKQLEANETMRASILRALNGGLPCIAECGGFLYLMEKLEGAHMVGFFPGEGRNTGKLSRFGYVTLTARKGNLLCPAGDAIPAHEFHYYDTTCNGEDFLAQKADGRHWDCGHGSETLYAGFPHFHFYAKPDMAGRFLRACESFLTKE